MLQFTWYYYQTNRETKYGNSLYGMKCLTIHQVHDVTIVISANISFEGDYKGGFSHC